MTNEQWVPALDVYKSAEEMIDAQARGGQFKWDGNEGPWDFVDPLKYYTYLLGSDPKEPANKHTAKQSREDYIKECARQVLDGKTLQWQEVSDEAEWRDDLDLSDALTSLGAACIDPSFEIRIKPELGKSELIVSAPIYFELNSEGRPQGFVYSRTDRDPHKLTVINDDGKLSATIEELKK